MYNFDISVMVFTEIMARRSFLTTNTDGTKDLALQAGGAHLKYNSLWNFIPEKQKEPGHTGVTIIWDARISHGDIYCSATERLAGVTLMGPCGQSLRILGVYGPASPSQCPTTVKLLHSHFMNELSRARRNNIPVLILGDFNDVPYGDLTFEDRNRTYPEAFGLISALQNMKFLDVFRTIHSQEHGYTFRKVRKKKSTLELPAADASEAPSSRSNSDGLARRGH
jgi:exonuclease III